MDLLDLTAENNSFSNEVPGLQVAWDSTSLGTLKTCPYKYFLSNICGWESARRALPLAFGILFHEAMEWYHRHRADGLDHDEATYEVVSALLRDQSENTKVLRESDAKERNHYALVRAVVWYLEEYRNDHAKTVILENGKPAVELSFRFGIGMESADGAEYLICGHMDRLASLDEDLWVTDYKTSKSTLSQNYFDGYSPANQMSLYTLAGKIVTGQSVRGVIIDGIQVAVNFNRFARGFAHRSQGQIDEWLEDTVYWIRQAERFALDEHWPMNDTACSMYGGCPFRKVCSKDPAVRNNFLRSDFVKRVWDPLKTREV